MQERGGSSYYELEIVEDLDVCVQNLRETDVCGQENQEAYNL